LNEIIPLDKLLKSRGAHLICYPHFDADEAIQRLGELRPLGVVSLELGGRHRIFEAPVLGKGHVGVVLKARLEKGSAALKIRRTDANKASLVSEAENLAKANRVSVGPRLLDVSDNFLLMELIEGEYLADWVQRIQPPDIDRLYHVLRLLIEKARRLDLIGLDHGELSRAHRHVIIAEDEPRIVDFESAGIGRRVANITSIAHYIYFNNQMRKSIEELIFTPEPEALIGALGRYKRSPTEGNYIHILEVCGLGARVQ
jgi:putative serine/threonine protein kinase